MTMLALTLSIGILIDDAIIVIENIYRHVEEGMQPREAAHFATKPRSRTRRHGCHNGHAWPIFLPVAFMREIIRSSSCSSP